MNPLIVFFKQKTAYEVRISDWSSDVCSSDLLCSPSVAAIVQLVRDGYGVAAIPALFVANEIKNGTFIELPIQPTPPSIVLSMRSEEHTSELQSLMRVSYAVCSLKKQIKIISITLTNTTANDQSTSNN